MDQAIEDCVSHGGGRVEVPAGTYLCGTIHLKSNVELHLAAGAVILAAPAEMKAYDEAEPWEGPAYQDGGHTYFHNSLIWAENEKNVSITGRGMIDGQGLTRHDTEKAGITGCDIATIDNVVIDTNRDGIDIDCCKYVTVSNCKVNTPNDDAIVLKSSYALKRPVMCEHIMVNNCLVSGYKLGTFLDGTYVPEKVNWVCGRIKLGTESNGGYRDIAITNCTCMWSSGLAFEEVDQGRMENIVVSNIAMNHVHHYPIYITTGCRNRGPKEVKDVSYGGNIQISNVVAQDVDSLAGIIITGMENHPLEHIYLSDIRIQSRGGGSADQMRWDYREQGTNYPEPKFAGATPAKGVFVRHARDVRLSNVTFTFQKEDQRPAVVLDDVEDVRLDNIFTPKKLTTDDVVLRNHSNVLF